MAVWRAKLAKSLSIFTPYGQLPHEVIVKAWQDSDFKARLLSEPNMALMECGYAIPATITNVRINTADEANFVLPEMPRSLLGASFEDMLDQSIAHTRDRQSGTCDTT